ncbi:hypothetical protein SUGI_1193250 [Cryptomeria japonica]|nr:hypothetical protein SUGI_1193250 [Cryptomeria japonica]
MSEKPMIHLLLVMFLHWTAVFMPIPPITDVTMAALCPGQEQCSHAIYLTGLQQVVFLFYFSANSFSVKWLLSFLSNRQI